jgi:hypothetical protein
MLGIPDQFVMVAPENTKRRCAVVWREAQRIGVAFYQSLRQSPEHYFNNRLDDPVTKLLSAARSVSHVRRQLHPARQSNARAS